MSGFGPSPTRWSDTTGPDGGEDTKIVVLANIGQVGLTDLELMSAGEHTPGIIPMEDPAGERVGTVTNVHYSLERRALIAEVTSGYKYRDDQLTTEFSKDKSKVVRLVLVR